MRGLIKIMPKLVKIIIFTLWADFLKNGELFSKLHNYDVGGSPKSFDNWFDKSFYFRIEPLITDRGSKSYRMMFDQMLHNTF
jgi:hypothetical protein